MAVAFDNSAYLGQSGSISVAYTCSGTNRILFVGVDGDGTQAHVSGATYGGVSMTLVDSTTTANGRWFYLFMLVAPAAGSNTIAVSSSVTVMAFAASYTGAAQTGQPDSHAKTGNTSSTASVSNTTIAANVLILIWVASNDGSQVLSSLNSSVIRSQQAPDAIGDSSVPTTAGAYTVGFNMSINTQWGIIAAGIAPALTNGDFLAFM